MKLKCDVCQKKKKVKNIFHFSGYVSGDFNDHIHICKDCTYRNTYDKYFINIPTIHIKNASKEINEC